MKKIAILLASGFLLVSTTACGGSNSTESSTAVSSSESSIESTIESKLEDEETSEEENPTVEEPTTEEIIGMPSPVLYFDTLEEAVGEVGFSISVPETIEGYEGRSVVVITSDNATEKLLQLQYGDENYLTIRKMKYSDGNEDISGVYDSYEEISVLDLGDRSVRLEGNDGKVYLATWRMEGYSYSLYAKDGMMDEIIDLIEEIR